VRISTTVDQERLAACRQLLATSDSKLFDRALALLLDALEAEREQTVLDALPYDSDPDLDWQAPPGADMPYDGDVPDDVQRLARARRRRQR
jgi:hypothetical protein